MAPLNRKLGRYPAILRTVLRWAFASTVLLLSVLQSCKGQPGVTDETLAIVGPHTVTKDDFIARYQEFRRLTGEGVPDTRDTRQKILNLIVDEEILIRRAEVTRVAEDTPGKHERQRIEIQELLNLFNRTVGY